jgi:hypothetical protein
MVYILTEQRDDEENGDSAFARYRAYLALVRNKLPRGAYSLASSDWYFNSTDHRAPHDAWLDEVSIKECPAAGDRARIIEIQIRLLGAYHDGWIHLRYKDVSRYRLELDPHPTDGARGHRDWRYDEYRLAANGRVEHEIEWWGSGSTGAWVIEAADVEFTWEPLESHPTVASSAT